MFLLAVGLVIAFVVVRKWILSVKAEKHKESSDVNVGIFHPYANAGGGGERVLWCAIRALQVSLKLKQISGTKTTRQMKSIWCNIAYVRYLDESVVF